MKIKRIVLCVVWLTAAIPGFVSASYYDFDCYAKNKENFGLGSDTSCTGYGIEIANKSKEDITVKVTIFEKTIETVKPKTKNKNKNVSQQKDAQRYIDWAIRDTYMYNVPAPSKSKPFIAAYGGVKDWSIFRKIIDTRLPIAIEINAENSGKSYFYFFEDLPAFTTMFFSFNEKDGLYPQTGSIWNGKKVSSHSGIDKSNNITQEQIDKAVLDRLKPYGTIPIK